MPQYLDTWSQKKTAGTLTLAQRIQLGISTLAKEKPGLISGLDQTRLAILADSSHWTGKLTKEVIQGADIWSPKGSDGHQIVAGAWNDLGNYKDDQLDNTIQTCYEVGRPVMPFHFVQWDYTADQWAIDKIIDWQVEIIANSLRLKKPHVSYHGYVLDCETKGCTDTNYQKIVAGLYNRLINSPLLDGMPLMIYTSQDMLNTYPAFAYWIAAKREKPIDLWMAQWVYTKAWAGTWEQYRAQVLPLINLRVVTPTGWAAAQYTATPRIHDFQLDVSAWCRTKDSLYNWLGYKGSVQPPLPPEKPPAEPGDYVTREEYEGHRHDLGGPVAA